MRGSDRRSVLLPMLSLNRRLRDPGRLSFRGLRAPLVLPSRDARSQCGSTAARRSGRCLRRNEDGRAGKVLVRNFPDKDKSHADHEG